MHRTLLLATAIALGPLVAPASAHHAVQAQFDVTKNIIITCTLAQVDWQNPHAWFWFDVKQPDGTMVRWGTETVGPNGLRRLGLSDRRLFVIGDTYKIDVNPDRSGKPFGFTNAFWFPDGKYIKVGFPENANGELPPGL